MGQKRPDRIVGGAHSAFWDWCAKGELRLQRCGGCGDLSWPAVEACNNCGSADLQWERLSGRGKVMSWCSFEKDYYKGTFPIPWNTILVELDEGPFFLSNPGDFTAEDIGFGMAVEVAFLPCEDSHGSFALPIFNRCAGQEKPDGTERA